MEYAWLSTHRKTWYQDHQRLVVWKRTKIEFGVYFHIVALQAVMADLLSGDTIHHALNLPVFGKNGSKPSEDKSEINTMRGILQLRWLIIDEISMVRAR